MQLATGGNMLNFGYWTDGTAEPVTAQRTLCSMVGETAELQSAKVLLDIGSGLGAPARQWQSIYDLRICCVNINREQLLSANGGNGHLSSVNGTSTHLPFADNCVDRIVALESAQHFKPLTQFVRECRRVIRPGGLLVIAIPVTASPLGKLTAIFKLGILSFTWSSEHYSVDYVKSAIAENGFKIDSLGLIGRHVYEPLTSYYLLNRPIIRERILNEYPSFLENVLHKSLMKMAETSRKGIIDYAVIKAS